MRILNPATLEIVDEHQSIRVGGVYVVLEIVAGPARRLSIRLHSDGDAPGLWDSAMFETVDPSIPPNWVARVSKDGLLEVGPEAWLAIGFWERYFDAEPAAVGIFEAERDVVLSAGSH